MTTRDELIELLAAQEHERWSSWEKWRGKVAMEEFHAGQTTAEKRWARQRETPYAELSEKEKESDRKEARKTLALIDDHGIGADEIQSEALNLLASRCYNVAEAKGFHEDDDKPGWEARYIANLHGEVSELWEAYRKQRLDKPCDKDIDLTCAAEELADIVIRTLDTAKAMGCDIGKAVMRKHVYNQTREYRHGGKVA